MKTENAISTLSQIWLTCIGEPAPTERQWRVWFLNYDLPTIKRGLQRVAQWALAEESKGGKHSHDELLRYASGVMASVSRSKEVPRG